MSKRKLPAARQVSVDQLNTSKQPMPKALLILLVLGVIMVIGGAYAIWSFMTVVGPTEEQSTSLGAIKQSYSQLTLPSQIEPAGNQVGCGSALDSCTTRMEYLYYYPAGTSYADAQTVVRDSLVKQGFVYDSTTDKYACGTSAELKVCFGEVYSSDSFDDTSLSDAKGRLKLGVELKQDTQ